MDLSIEEAYKAMVSFLEKYYERTNSDEIGGLLSDMILIEQQSTADPAIWHDWLDCINQIKNTD
ncbi:hypothetical protein [Clostridium aciditolerans]|uniref:Uncharacterized protein n=1 Tax=Clostridium aciditolerans TaxID=339861 RepID=A0A934M069_9CLOT|nr:hypothetical protein [Clostridium aciditolerans]MBI6871799.1 hypothetical protein [Clostridium aciditolerans]